MNQDDKIEPRLTYALDKDNRLVSIKNVVRGKACNCFCPKCKKPLLAKKGGTRQDHFAHIGDDGKCEGAYMTALHKLAEQIISDKKSVMVPSYLDIPSQLLSFDKVEVEQRNDRKDLQPDVVGITKEGVRLHIEIRNTSEIKSNKISKIRESDFFCLEIDVRKVELNDLEKFLLSSDENREWINIPTKISNQAEKVIYENKKIRRPSYKSIASGDITFKKVHIINNDLLQNQILDNRPYILCETSKEYKILIVINDKKELTSTEITTIKDKELICLEINIDGVPTENIADFILKSDEKRRWINNPEYEEYLEKKNREEEKKKERKLAHGWGHNNDSKAHRGKDHSLLNSKLLEKKYQELGVNKPFDNPFYEDNIILDYCIVQNREELLIMCIDKNYSNYSKPIHIISITENNGGLRFKTKKNCSTQKEAEIYYIKLKESHYY